jgi:hypothetical protein
MFLALGILAIALAAELIVGSTLAFYVAGVLATSAVLPDSDLFSYVMTESLTFGLYSLAAYALVRCIAVPAFRNFLVAGVLFGVLVLTRTAYVILIFVVPALLVIACVWRNSLPMGRAALYAATFFLAAGVVTGAWMARNALSVGHWGLSEEYGSATLIERFAFNSMTAQEFALAFPFCLPTIGPPLLHQIFGKAPPNRFVYNSPGSFFQIGRGTRESLLRSHGRLDPLLAGLVKSEMRKNWWRHLLVSVPLGWCGMWVGGPIGLVLIPLFAAALVLVWRAPDPLFLAYSSPAFVMLGMHALIANHYTRYNLILIGPFAAAGSMVITKMLCRCKGQREAVQP